MTRQSEEQIRSAFYNILVEALRIDPADVTPEARIFSDLGAESIDILDIQFQIERAFGLKLDQNELLESLGQDLSALEIDERLTVQRCLDYINYRLKDADVTQA